jgi:hypothetical protein
MLLAECALGGVDVALNARGISVERGGSGGFRVRSSMDEIEAESVVVATGGLSIPKMGATGLGYELARQFGLNVVEPRPALVPLLLGGDEKAWTELAGVATEVVAWVETAEKNRPSGAKTRDPIAGSIVGVKTPTYQPVPSRVSFREKMLVTHRGVSGPAVLQASSYWRPGEELVLDLAPGREVLAMLRGPGARRDLAGLRLVLREVLPQRLAGFLADAGAPAGWGNVPLDALEKLLHGWRLHPVGTEGFEKAEVTAGGVDTDGLHSRTMEARAVPGLYFIGEAVDVTGWLGGFNFQWAWASGVAAGKAV